MIHHIVLTETAILIVRWPGAEWRDLQDHFDGYVTSFGPLEEDEARDLIDAEWPEVLRQSEAALRRFFADGEAKLLLSGRE
jgi:hypothetical protein